MGPRGGLNAAVKKKNPFSCRYSNLGCAVHSPVIIFTEIPRLVVVLQKILIYHAA
jgi:hypothetical protein